MSYDAHFRVWRGDVEVVLDIIHRTPHPGSTACPRPTSGARRSAATDNAIIPMKERVVDRRYDPLV